MSPLTEPTKLVLKKDSVAATDVNIRDVSLLLHGDLVTTSTNIVDSSLNPKTVTPIDNAQISTAVADPFGNYTGVLAFDGNGDYLTVPDSSDFHFGTANFTIEFWIYPNNNNNWWVFGKGDSASAAGSAFSFYNGGTYDFYHSGGALSISRPALTVATWHHIAVVRNGSTISIYKNGSQNSTGNIGTNSINSALTRPLQIGLYSVSGFNGYLSNFRITKGVARYTSNFTPPTAPFPDF